MSRLHKSTRLGQMESQGNSLHIFTAESQPATKFVDRSGKKPIWFRNKPQRQTFTRCCRKRRHAKNLRVQVFYDSINFFCAQGKGCKA